jgi:hypothetical protein
MFSTRKLRRFVFSFLAFTVVASSIAAQVELKKEKPSPAKIEEQPFVVGESVVREQWTHTLKLVNVPMNVTLLNPGQCVRVGVIATGDNRDSYLEKTKLSFRIKFAGQSQDHALAPIAEYKQIKPEGGDFVTAALAAGGIPNPMLTMASLGVSAEKWCVPVDAVDGTATLETEVETPSGHQNLKRATVQIESYETGSKKLFKDANELSDFLQTYYRQPHPARLLPAMQAAITYQTANPKSDFIENAAAFLSAALKADPVAAQDFLTRIGNQPPLTRGLGLTILRSSGYDIQTVVKTLGPGDQEKIQSMPPLPDPYDMTANGELFHHLDLMWSTFGATGQLQPVKTIASALSWRSDYDNFDKMRKSGTRITELTPSIARGLAYGASGWSLSSFQRSDPLAVDYIEYMLASPDIPDSVKTELKGLSTNPAFKQADKK